MKRDEIERLYDAGYAASYDERYLLSDISRPDADFELALLTRLLKGARNWLDAACGTGHFLAKFPYVDRAGLDLSTAMLTRARVINPGVELRQWDFRDSIPEWRGRWDLVSCMWYAYGLVDSLREVEMVVQNLADWTAPGGSCFLPVVDPAAIAETRIPLNIATPYFGYTRVEGLIWSYVENDGTKVHKHMIAPQLDVMKEIVQRHFDHVELVQYPIPHPGRTDSRTALVARQKRA